MVRLTRRESALSMLAGAPLDHVVTVPEKRKRDPAVARESHLQRDCVSAIRERRKFDRHLTFIAPGATQNNLTPAQRAYAKSQGWESGWPDIWLLRNNPFKLMVIELKMPKTEKRSATHLTAEQQAFFAWCITGRIACARVDDLREFCRILDAF